MQRLSHTLRKGKEYHGGENRTSRPLGKRFKKGAGKKMQGRILGGPVPNEINILIACSN